MREDMKKGYLMIELLHTYQMCTQRYLQSEIIEISVIFVYINMDKESLIN